MPVNVLMPQFGESVVEGTITRWLKAPGDPVAEFEPLVEVNTDKVDTEIPSPAAGIVLEIRVGEGVTAQAGTLLAVIGNPDETPGSTESSPAAQFVREAGHEQAAALAAPPYFSASAGQEAAVGFISPLVRRMAGEHQLDLSQIQGSGRSGRITKHDVEAFLSQQQSHRSEPARQPRAEAGSQVIPLTPVRRMIAEHMVNSVRTSPHVTTVMEADLSRVAAHRQANKAAFERDDVNLTFTAYFAMAAVTALKKHQIVNSSWSENGIVLHPAINIGMAASLGEAGLIVPVIKDAASLSLLGLSRAINDLARRARSKQLKPEEVQSGTFTITNHGTTGSLFATPIINQPQCAIMGVGMIQKRPVVVSDTFGSDALAIRPMVYLSLTFDHRILDGAVADGFLGMVVELLQNWA